MGWPVDTRKKVGKNLKALIKARGYPTPELFAHENEFSKSWVYRIIRGEVDPVLSNAARLAKALGVTLDDLFPIKRRR